ncbi:hypothetical protein TNCV_1910621 [Trichonephila clavipes]|nr:hypothetical protein TNCV_1910621 [Trichonephila clavipes]
MCSDLSYCSQWAMHPFPFLVESRMIVKQRSTFKTSLSKESCDLGYVVNGSDCLDLSASVFWLSSSKQVFLSKNGLLLPFLKPHDATFCAHWLYFNYYSLDTPIENINNISSHSRSVRGLVEVPGSLRLTSVNSTQHLRPTNG